MKSLEDKIEKLDGRVEKIDNKLDRISETLIRNTESLEYHIKRTNLLETKIEALDADLKPVERHVTLVNGIIRSVLVFVPLVGGILAILKVLEVI